MASIFDWSKTAGDNDTADSDINWQENQVPSTVNNSARQMMGRVAELLDDLGSVTSATNLLNAYTLTANSAFTALADGLIVGFRASATNTGAATLNVNALGSKAIRGIASSGDVALAAGAIVSGQKYQAVYDSTANAAAGGWILLNKGNPEIPSGSRVPFYQAAAPTGWTKVTGLDNRAMRVVDGAGGGTGGSVGFSTLFARTATDAHTLTTTEMPVHAHTASTGNVSNDHTHAFAGNTSTESVLHSHDYSLAGNPVPVQGGGAINALTTGLASSTTTTAESALHYHSYSGNTGGISTNHNHAVTVNNAGSGGSHSHNIDMRLTYIDVIVCSKD